MITGGRAASLKASHIGVRVVTATVGIPVVMILVFVGGMAFAISLSVVAVVGCIEAFSMLRQRGHSPSIVLGLLLGAELPLIPMLPNPAIWWRGSVLVGILLAASWLLFSKRAKDQYVNAVLTVSVPVYVGGLLSSLASIRGFHHGLTLVVLVLVITWTYDTGAYFAGRLYGRTSFMAHVSPSKTVEGVGGGLLLAVVSSLVCAILFGIMLPEALIIAVLCGLSGQMGDLFESQLKRYCGVKDSGKIVPGHGGVLDRVDALLFSGTAAYYLFVVFRIH